MFPGDGVPWGGQRGGKGFAPGKTPAGTCTGTWSPAAYASTNSSSALVQDAALAPSGQHLPHRAGE